MSTLILNVNSEQEKILEGLLNYMEVPFQKVSNSDDFWLQLSVGVKERIEKGLRDVDNERLSSAKTYLGNLLEQ